MAARRPSAASIASPDIRPSNQNNIDIFDDEFAEDYAESIHTTAPRRENPFRDPVDYAPSSPLPSERQAFLLPDSHQDTSLRTRSSITKAPLLPLSMTSETQAQDRGPEIATVATYNVPHRTLSIASTSSIIHETPSQAGPSHPYTMYPQNFALSRTVSGATSQGRAATSAQNRGPAHPYNMYPQTTGSGIISDAAAHSQPIPLGFPGHGLGFQRRTGPEGEEQDIIGAEGHAEQLPAYSRYPETYDNKSAAAGLLSAIPEPISPGSREAPLEMSERSRQDEVYAHVGDEPVPPTGRAVATTTGGSLVLEKESERTWKEKTFKGKMKHKWLGKLRVWWVLLFLAVSIVIAAICGGVIGSFILKAKQRFHQTNPPFTGVAHSSSYTTGSVATTLVVTTTQFIDATPIATPASLSSLPTGVFSVTFATSSVHSASCLLDSAQKVAWSCQFPSDQSTFGMNVESNNSGSFVTMLNDANPTGNNTDYGTQPPSFESAPLSLVQDLENSTYGPSYQFSSVYNKLVILPSTNLQTNSKLRRQVSNDDPSTPSGQPPSPYYTGLPWWATKKRIQPGDTPWFCWFNSTYVDGFIYVNTPEDTPVSASSSATLASSSTFQTSTLSSTGVSSSNSGTPTTINIPGGNVAKRQTTSQTATASTPSFYPKVVKVEERRIADQAVSGVCTMMEKSADGTSYVPMTVSGSLVTLALNETDPVSTYVTKRDSTTHIYPSGCYCQWST